MSRSLFAFFSLAAIVVMVNAAITAETKPGSELGKDIRIPSNIGMATNITQDNQVATLLFDNLIVSVEPAQNGAATTLNQTAIQTKAFTVNVPFTTDQRSLPFTLEVRGFAQQDPEAIVRLIACVGDTTKIIDLSSDPAQVIKLKGKSKPAIVAAQPNKTFGDFQNRVEFTVQKHAANPVIQITLCLLAEHDTDVAGGGGGALLAIDSLDLSIGKSGKGTLK
jgi:hypothetical protein